MIKVNKYQLNKRRITPILIIRRHITWLCSLGERTMANVITNIGIVAAMVATMFAVNYPYLIQ